MRVGFNRFWEGCYKIFDTTQLREEHKDLLLRCVR